MGWAVLGLVAFLGGVAEAQTVPGATVEERAANGARAYLKKIGANRLEQTMMLVSLFAKAQPKYLDEWERLTGIRIRTVEYGYTEIPAKIMAEALEPARVVHDDIARCHVVELLKMSPSNNIMCAAGSLDLVEQFVPTRHPRLAFAPDLGGVRQPHLSQLLGLLLADRRPNRRVEQEPRTLFGCAQFEGREYSEDGFFVHRGSLHTTTRGESRLPTP